MADIPVTPIPPPTPAPAPLPTEVSVWYKNYTLWANVIAIAGIVLPQFFGIQIDPKVSAGVMAILNVILQAPKMAVTESRAMAHNKAIRAKLFR